MIAQAATTPLEYYQWTEKDNLYKHVDSLSKNYADYILNYQKALKQQIGLETTLQATFDSSITNGTDVEGLKSLKATMISMSKGKESKTNVAISCNDQDITSLEAFTTLDNLIYLLIPNLSEAFLKIDANNMQGDTSTALTTESIDNYLNDPISENLINQLLRKYGTILIDNIDNVTMKKNVNVSVDNIKDKYTRLTVIINEMNTLEMSKAILNTAKKDNDLRNIFIDLGICTKAEYDDAIKEGLTKISSSQKALKEKKSNGEQLLKMYLWINSKGDIAGRSISVNSNEEIMTFGYRTTKSATKMGIEAWAISDGKDILRATGSLAAKLTGVSGDIDITYTDTYLETKSVVNVKVKDAKYTKSDNGGFINGVCAITSKSFDGMSFNIKCSGELGKQEILFDILQNSKSIASISSSAKEVPFIDFKLPSSTDKSFDLETQMNDYIQGADIKGFLIGIKEKSDIKFIDSYIDSILANY